MKTAYLDCFSGISGDMLLGAFLDAGWDAGGLLSLPERLGLPQVEIFIDREERSHIVGTRVRVHCPRGAAFRGLGQIQGLLTTSSIPEGVVEEALQVFDMLAEAEGRVHGISKHEVHFHELGACDTIIDVVGSLLAVRDLGIHRVICSPLPLSRGFVHTDHGPLPLPAPAVMEILKGKTIYFTDVDLELVTPTGAALVACLADDWGYPPPMTIDLVGYGVGSAHIKDRPNLLRIVVGQDVGGDELDFQVIVQLSAVIDDMNPELLGYFQSLALEEGAFDIWFNPVYMKKNRPGVELVLLAPLQLQHKMVDLVLSHTSTLGVRVQQLSRCLLPRKKVVVQTRWGPVEAKKVLRPGGTVQVIPEFEACKEVAERTGVPLWTIYKDVAAAGEGDDR